MTTVLDTLRDASSPLVGTYMSTLIDLLRIARPQFLVAGLAVFVFGAAWAVLAGAPFDLSRAAAAYAVLVPAHLSVSYSNDAFDLDADRFGRPTLISGGSGVLVRRPDLRRAALWIALLLHGASLIGGLLFQWAYAHSWALFGFVLAGNAVAWWYTAPPLRLVYRGFGEIALALSIGGLIPGYGVLAAGGSLEPSTVWLGVPLMLFGLAFVLAVQIPDLEADRLGGKSTWVARHGRGPAFVLLTLALALAALTLFGASAWAASDSPAAPGVLGLLALLPLGVSVLALRQRHHDQRATTRAAVRTLFALVAFCLLADGYLLLIATRSI